MTAAASAFPGPERALLAREKLNQVWRSVEFLSQQQRTVFLLRFAEEMSLAEVSQILGLQIGTVKAHLFRATEKVRNSMRENYAIHP